MGNIDKALGLSGFIRISTLWEISKVYFYFCMTSDYQ
jgi:hypothetical protein